MAVTDTLGAPDLDSRKRGRFTLNRIWDVEAAASEPVAATNLENIQAVTIDPPAWDYEDETLQQGGGNHKVTDQGGIKWTGQIICLGGKVGETLASIRALTWTAAGNGVGMPLRRMNPYPTVHWEAVCRDKTNSTHLFTVLIQDMIIGSLGWDNPMDYADGTIPWYSYHDPIFLLEGHETVYDVYDGDGSTTVFSLSGTAVSCVDASENDDFALDTLIHCKTKLTTDDTGTHQLSGVSEAAGDVTYTTAPAASSKVQILYAIVTV